MQNVWISQNLQLQILPFCKFFPDEALLKLVAYIASYPTEVDVLLISVIKVFKIN